MKKASVFCYQVTTGIMALNYAAALGTNSNVKIKIDFYQLQDWIEENGKQIILLFVCPGNDLKKDYYNQKLAAGWHFM